MPKPGDPIKSKIVYSGDVEITCSDPNVEVIKKEGTKETKK